VYSDAGAYGAAAAVGSVRTTESLALPSEDEPQGSLRPVWREGGRERAHTYAGATHACAVTREGVWWEAEAPSCTHNTHTHDRQLPLPHSHCTARPQATMELLRKMVEVVATNLRSRRIHLGLDEPFGVESTPEGQRLSAERRVALRQHLHRLVTMCHSHGLRPMAYSDPLFRQSSASNDYYDEAVPPLAWTDVKELPQVQCCI
jgi:hypothetical protein